MSDKKPSSSKRNKTSGGKGGGLARNSKLATRNSSQMESARAPRVRSDRSPSRAEAPAGPRRRWKLKLAAGLVLTGLLFLLYPLPGIVLMRWHEPGPTAFMRLHLERAGKSAKIRQDFVPLGQISSHLREAVIVSEDDAFFDHWGVDLRALKESVETNLEKRRFARGASTITMQLAKNLYLSPEKSLLRKGRELAITLLLEAALPKERILELYLNVIEWGPGVYGAEAAARHWFGTSAAKLTSAQAAALAAAIPTPRKSNPAKPSASLARKRDRILERMRKKGVLR
jgi:monofunctional glycosyltransferase